VAVKLDSRGPMFFIQDRAGRNGRPFGLIKFRTMHPATGPTSEWVSDNVSRITRVGYYLRHFRLDELPQLLNVLRGEMNLVGPRPHPVTNQAIFMEHIAYYGLRSTVRPGVTGWAQIRYGYANNLAEETEKMRYDLYYIKNRSLWLDLRIMLETVATVIFGKGATEVSRPSPGWRSDAARSRRSRLTASSCCRGCPRPRRQPSSHLRDSSEYTDVESGFSRTAVVARRTSWRRTSRDTP
jgi:lipopolysaccharide/colanic/teichoic acid biosynthesis glycosyltransferase